MGLRKNILFLTVAGLCLFPLADAAFPQGRPGSAGPSAGPGTVEQQITAAKAKAWTLFYAGKFQAAATAAQPLLKCGQHDVEQEATHLIARCLWAADTPKTRAEAQQAWQQLDKPLAGSANKLRLDIAKALVLDAPPTPPTPPAPPKTTEAIELLERDFILQGRGGAGGTAQAEAAIELAALYAEDGKPDKAGKLLDAIGPFFAPQNLARLELDPADVAPFLKAADAAKAALSAAPASPGQAEFQRAEALRASGRYQDAFKAYQLVIAKFPDTDFAPHSELCLGYCELGLAPTRPQQAIDRWKAFVAAAPEGPWRGQAYVALIDTALDPLLDLGEAEKQADAAVKAMARVGDDEKAAPSWKLAAFDLQVRLGTVNLLRGRSQAAADDFEQAIQLHGSSDDTGTGLTLLDNAAKSGQSVLPSDVKLNASGNPPSSRGPDDKIALALAIGTIDNITGRFAAASSLFDRLSKAANAQGMTPCRSAYAQFGNAMALVKLNKPAAAKAAFILSLKLYAPGTQGGWHDETLYRLALLIQDQSGATPQVYSPADSPRPPLPAHPGVTDAGSDKTIPNIAEQTLARAAKSDAAQQEALPYWQLLLARYPSSPRIDAAEYYGGIAAADAGQFDLGIKLLQQLVKDHPQSPFVGDACIRVIDVALEQMFDVKRAKSLAAAGLDWLKSGTAVPVVSPDSGTAVPAVDSSLAPWRRSGYEFTPTPPDRVKYELYLRQGLVAYLQADYAAASEAFDSAGPEEPVNQIGGSVDIAHVGLHFLVKAAHAKKAVTTDTEVWKDTATDQQRTAVNLGNIYLEGIRPDKADEVFTRILHADPVLGKVSNALKGYAILQLGVAIDREGRRQEALAWFKELATSPQFAGTFWQPYGLFRLAVFTHNLTQDQRKSMPIYRDFLARYPDHPEAEDALFFYMQDAMETNDYKLERVLGEQFLAKYPKSWWTPACAKYLSQIPNGDSR